MPPFPAGDSNIKVEGFKDVREHPEFRLFSWVPACPPCPSFPLCTSIFSSWWLSMQTPGSSTRQRSSNLTQSTYAAPQVCTVQPLQESILLLSNSICLSDQIWPMQGAILGTHFLLYISKQPLMALWGQWRVIENMPRGYSSCSQINHKIGNLHVDSHGLKEKMLFWR